MRREDKFIGLVADRCDGQPADFGDGPVAEFKHAFPFYNANEDYRGRTFWVLETHFRANLKSLRQRIENLKLPKNYGKVPWSLVQERAAERAILSAAA